MEGEIDLREYLDLLARRWKWIAGLTALVALLAGIVSFMIPPRYETTASVFVLPKKAQNIAVAGALGLLVSVFGVFAVEYFGKLRST